MNLDLNISKMHTTREKRMYCQREAKHVRTPESQEAGFTHSVEMEC